MPIEFYIICGACLGVMGLSAFYLGDENRNVRGFARVGVVLGGTTLFLSAMFYFSIMIAVLIVILPVVLIVAFFQGIFS